MMPAAGADKNALAKAGAPLGGHDAALEWRRVVAALASPSASPPLRSGHHIIALLFDGRPHGDELSLSCDSNPAKSVTQSGQTAL